MYNKVIMMGRLVADPELKTTPQGVSVCSFRIAVDRRFQTKGEEKKSDFFNVVAWRQQAEFVSRYFNKGRLILVEGELNTRQYTDKNGNPSTWYEIVADRLSFAGDSKPQGGAYSESYPAPAPSAPPVQSNQAQQISAPAADFSSAATDDDYPF